MFYIEQAQVIAYNNIYINSVEIKCNNSKDFNNYKYKTFLTAIHKK